MPDPPADSPPHTTAGDGSPTLWHHADFMKLWVGQTISLGGSALTGLALPLLAALTLHATAAEMGLLAAVGTAPSLVVGLVAGVWVDRYRCRPLLIAGDLSRALLLQAATDADIRPLVAEAVEDAETVGTQDFGLTTLIVIGAVSLLWRWRPKSVEKTRDGIKIEWPDDKGGNDGLGAVLKALGKAAGL
jgi:MFS family permease